ncbi:glycine cleavage system protein GcvH [Betaproteobacteria bacterium SCN2]|jgi:glycine cleavage system H protein|nr:glycine cleavage system protein GcvH [Betaproteobacteria bacterium SCN2]
MSIPADLKYTKSHEWVKVEADGTVSVGITHHAQDLLGDMVFVENPAVGRKLNAGEECAVVESVKAASDVYAPLAGEVVAANDEVESSPEKINQDAYGAWMFKIRPASPADVNALLDAAAYEAHVASEAH